MTYATKPIWLIVATTLLLSACMTTKEKQAIPPPSIEGDYVDNYQNSQKVEATQWAIGNTYYFSYVLVDNAANYLTAHNGSSNEYYPNKFSRFEWMNNSDGLWFCQQVYDADSAAKANNFLLYPKANPTSPSTGGCGLGSNNFPWSKLTPVTH